MSKPKPAPKSAWVPNGIDPTELDYPLERPTVAGCGWKIGQVLIVLLAVYGGITLYTTSQQRAAANAPKPSPTLAPMATIQINTPTPLPTQTPVIITTTPLPTATLPEGFTPNILPSPVLIVVTATPAPTLIPSTTPSPTATYTPAGFAATWTPGAWMITRWAATVEADR